MQKAIYLQSNHNKVCTGGRLEFLEEKRKGLASTLVYKCNMCKKKVFVQSEPTCEKSKINYAAVWGTLATGGCYSHLAELLSVMDIPKISSNTFFEFQRELGSVSKKIAIVCLFVYFDLNGAISCQLIVPSDFLLPLF